MRLVPFETKHIQQAKRLAELNFNEENKRLNNILPKTDIPDLSEFAENALGVAAFDGNELIGFIGGYGPCRNHFGKTDGIWAPVHVNGTTKKNRQYIYSKMYQYISGIWVDKGILSHSITLYANDTYGINSFFDNGFGKRCVDGIMELASFGYELNNTDLFYELSRTEFNKVHNLSNLTKKHLQKPPAFMPRKVESPPKFIKNISEDIRIFAAEKDNEVIAYLQIQDTGETFISQNKKMVNITGAYLLEKYRGCEIYSNFLYYVADVVKNEGYTYLGVDYESINPEANRFWQKHFKPYTYGLVRRIDERILELR